MIDINVSSRGKSTQAVALTRSLRIDMTPMVDLGFLLITFFIFSSVLSKPTAMNLLVPRAGPPTGIPESKTLTVLVDDGKVICYEGFVQSPAETHIVDMRSGQNNLRNLVARKQQSLKNSGGSAASLVVIIKPTPRSNYQQLVTVLDEMTISAVKKYTIADVDAEDEKLLSLMH
ncbi:MAG TPA: biopolymer transporter ExbD [Agriterribacter sp.]|nr:biopolymer transporter ExbD [Agriterribacter sp.]